MNKPTLYLMLGYPGAGKTTVAKLISQLADAIHLWADKERVHRFGSPSYSHDENLSLYDELNKQTAISLKAGKSVVFDTNFSLHEDRAKLRDIARESGADCKLIWVQTPRVIAKTRATEDAHQQETRLLGNIPEHDFERMSDKIEEPSPAENPIVIEGIDVTPDIIKQKLGL